MDSRWIKTSLRVLSLKLNKTISPNFSRFQIVQTFYKRDRSPKSPKISDENPKISDEDPKISDEDPKISDKDPKISDEDPKISVEYPKMFRV